MSNPTPDRRVLRTKRLIRDALTELMADKGFEGITVSDLTFKADINRGTFYLHYRDKYDLLEQSENEILNNIEEISKEVQDLNLKDILSYHQNKPIPFLLKLFKYFLENSGFMKVILGPKGDPSFQVKMKEVMRKHMLQTKTLKNDELTVPAEYFVAYISSAHLGIIQYWLESGMKETPDEMSLILSKMTFLGPGNVADTI